MYLIFSLPILMMLVLLLLAVTMFGIPYEWLFRLLIPLSVLVWGLLGGAIYLLIEKKQRRWYLSVLALYIAPYIVLFYGLVQCVELYVLGKVSQLLWALFKYLGMGLVSYSISAFFTHNQLILEEKERPEYAILNFVLAGAFCLIWALLLLVRWRWPFPWP